MFASPASSKVEHVALTGTLTHYTLNMYVYTYLDLYMYYINMASHHNQDRRKTDSRTWTELTSRSPLWLIRIKARQWKIHIHICIVCACVYIYICRCIHTYPYVCIYMDINCLCDRGGRQLLADLWGSDGQSWWAKAWTDMTERSYKINKTGLKQSHFKHLHVSKDKPTGHLYGKNT